MSVLDILKLIPPGLQQQIADALVDFVSGQAKKLLGDTVSVKIAGLKSDGSFKKKFREGLQHAADRFVREYELQDEDLVAAIAADESLFNNQQVQRALLAIIQKPGVYLADEREVVVESFETVLPERRNRQRVDRAVTFFLRCLAEELWSLPELHSIYSLQFQRMTAEAVRQQVELQKAQLQATAGLSADVRQALLELTDAVAERKLLPAPDAPTLDASPKVYHNLPQPDYGTFIGREEELKQVHRILRPYPHSRHAVVTIDGIGGIGKSALALEVAHRYLRDYDRLPPEERFDAIVWTSAKSSTLTADGIKPRQQVCRTLEDIYNAIAVALDREDVVRSLPEEQDDLICKALIQQRSLLVLDNLETVDDERVNAFLRELPAPTKAIVTTRHRIDVAYPVRLTRMSEQEGNALIAQECNKKGVELTDAEVGRLYSRTGGVPLAIVWSVAQMGYGYSADAILHRLGQPTEDISRFCFLGAVEHIRDLDAYALLIALSLFTVDASRTALGYVAGSETDVSSRDEGLVTLERLSLVNKRGDRFSMLPLTKAYVSSVSTAYPDVHTLETRWIGYFVGLSTEYGGEHWNWANYEWLLAEGENILGLFDWAVTDDRIETALRLYNSVMRYLNIKGRWTELIEYGELFYKVAQSLGERRILAWICTHWLGFFYAEQGMAAEAEKMTKESIALYDELGDSKGVCLAMGELSRALRKGGQLAAGLSRAQEMLRYAEELGYAGGLAAAYNELGKIARDQEQWAEAKEYFERSQDYCQKQDADMDAALLMNNVGNLGWAEFRLGNYNKGKELCERSFGFFENMGGRGYLTSLQCQLAAMEIALGNKEAARRQLQEASYWAERLRMPRETKVVQDLWAQIGDMGETGQ